MAPPAPDGLDAPGADRATDSSLPPQPAATAPLGAAGQGARQPRKAAPHRRKVPLVAVYAVALVAFTTYVLLDAFVIPRSYAAVAAVSEGTASADEGGQGGGSDRGRRGGRGRHGTHAKGDAQAQDGSQAAESSATITDTSYTSGSTSATLATTRYADTDVYVVDIVTDDPKALLAGFANDTYGKNVTATVSEMAEAAGAVVAVNGDYYGARNDGYVVRNGVLYRDAAAGAAQEDLVVWGDGSFEIVREGDVGAAELVEAGAWQVLSFGPGLVEDGEVAVDAGDEVGRAMASNPRTALAQLGEGHYALVVSDGRTDASAGLTLEQLATFLAGELGATCAYNLDGGGSSTLWFDGQVVNNPTTNGDRVGERSVSDIVYLAR